MRSSETLPSLETPRKSRKALRAIGGAFLVGALSVGTCGSALAAPAPILTFEPTHVDLTPGETWDNDIDVQTTKVLPVADLVILVDRTRSMERQIEWVADGLAEIVSKMIDEGASDLQISVVGYDDATSDRGEIGDKPEDAVDIDLTLGDYSPAQVSGVLNQIADNVRNSVYRDGGDGPEDMVYAMMRTAVETPWRAGSQRNIVAVTDNNVKIRTDMEVAGQPVTEVGLKTLLDMYGIKTSIQATDISTDLNVDHFGTATAMITADLAQSVGAAYSESTSYTDLTNNIIVDIVDSNPTWDLTTDITCTYESDGAPSTDIDLAVTPSPLTLIGGESGKITEHATVKNESDRPGDATVCVVQLFINGSSAGDTYRQTIRSQSPALGQLAAEITADPATGTTLENARTVTYTLTAQNATSSSLSGTVLTNDLTDVLDDATIDPATIKTAITMPTTPRATTDKGTATITGNLLEWNGTLPSNATITVSYAAVTNTASAGNKTLNNRIQTSAPQSNCTAGSTAPECATTHPITTAAAPTPQAASNGKLPITGSESGLIIGMAASLLLLGATIIIYRRRQTSAL